MKQVIPTLTQLEAQYAVRHIPYQTLLGTQEWKSKRDAVVERDGRKCTKCGCSATDNIWHGGKMHYLLSVPRNPDELVEIGGIFFRGKDLEDEIHQLYAPVILHVHHLYYVKSKYPWEYSSEALTTLCNDCHLEVHNKEIIPVYEIDNGNQVGLSVEVCSRCNGAGYFPQYNHVEAGICFACKGSRYTNLEL